MTLAVHKRSEVAKLALRRKFGRSPIKKASWTSTRSRRSLCAITSRGCGTPVDSGNRPQSADIGPQSLSAVIETISRSGRDAFSRMQRVEAQKRELDQQIQALQSDLERIRSGAKDARTVVVNLVADGAGDLRVSYQSARCGMEADLSGGSRFSVVST
jgi:hypothetical protein